jgi:hypothetical protein
MWQVLERKQTEMKQKKEHAEQHGHKEWNSHGVQSSTGFARFNGPRRKAG